MMMRPRPWNPERSQTRRSMTSEHESKRFAHLASQQICQTPQPPRAQVQARCFVSGGCAPCLMICPHAHGPLLSFRLTFAGFLYWGTATTSTSNRSRDLATGHAHTHTRTTHAWHTTHNNEQPLQARRRPCVICPGDPPPQPLHRHGVQTDSLAHRPQGGTQPAHITYLCMLSFSHLSAGLNACRRGGVQRCPLELRAARLN